jgi:site-specific DNA recombinase
MAAAAIYARVSSQRQKEEQTIDSQVAALREHAESSGLEIPRDWVFQDEGYSGATLVRPALERLRDLVAQVHVEVVLCYAPDRLARKYAYQALLIEELSRCGTEVSFVKGPKSDTPEDELLLQFQGMIAEYEKAQIIERTRRGKLHRARAGSTNVLSGAPYGYRYARKTDDSDARYEIIEPHAQVVRDVFARYVEDHMSIAAVARWLAEQRIPTATGKAVWDRSVVWGMLKNPAYAGHAAFGKTRHKAEPGRLNRIARLQGRTVTRESANETRPQDEWIEIAVPAIVSEETFALAARRLEDNKRFATRRTKDPTLLQGIIVCDQCDYAYWRTATRTTARKLYYYRCLGSDDWRYEHGRVCDSRPVRQDYIDAVVWDHVIALLSDSDLIRRELDRRLSELRTINPATAQRSRLELELTRTTAAMNRLVQAYQEDLLSLDELRSRMPDLRKKESAVRAQLDALEAQLIDQETYLKLAENLESFLARLRDAADSSSVEERQRVLRLIVKEVRVGPERLVIRHSIPAPGSDPAPGYLLCGRSQQPAALQRCAQRLGRSLGAARASDRGARQVWG